MSVDLEKKIDTVIEGIVSLQAMMKGLIDALTSDKSPLSEHARTIETFSVFGSKGESSAISYVRDSLIPTLSAITTLEKQGDIPTASAIASITKRSRNAESANLSKLAELGFCTRFRVGRKVTYPLRR